MVVITLQQRQRFVLLEGIYQTSHSSLCRLRQVHTTFHTNSKRTSDSWKQEFHFNNNILMFRVHSWPWKECNINSSFINKCQCWSPDVQLLWNPSRTRTETFTSQGHMVSVQNYEVTRRRKRSVAHLAAFTQICIDLHLTHMNVRRIQTSALENSKRLHPNSRFHLLLQQRADAVISPVSL